MFFTGFVRYSSDIQNSKASKDKDKTLREMLSLVDEGERILVSKDINLDEFGILLDTAWKFKRKTGGNVSTPIIDEYYKKALKAGALGGKLLGAGGGGFLLFYVPEDKKTQVMAALKDLLYVPFEFENGGTSIIHYSDEAYGGIGELL